ncbi:2-hydroxyacid dehydrogenase [Novosphingobium colocasiae]|uniref:Glyoxylate/hydroxypyruvate reductase A n=1 Tax=Novosphingobium colocasiae TaxID=1256513 RepID=A0A918PI99_9SPHN|nr:glyoxylate/hydroxypyruvate reductase A [Novosphingobium colocasiae]GGZ07932.1 glyoxylate/hydroxypyruvate reductase A [Novosphingobium colocasiae]
MTAILHCGDEERGRIWADVFARDMPEVDFRCWPDIGDAADVRYLVAWTMTPELIAALPALEVLFSIGAGVDQLDLSLLPPHVRVVRMIEPGITTTMAQYVAMACLALHRDLPFFHAEQRAGRWSYRPVRLCSERSVGFLGLGELARASLAALAPLGFRLHGWSRSGATIPGVQCHAGAGQLDTFLAQCDILVCLLPLTDDTRGILCRDLFAKLPRGASLVNVARGGHLVQDDLIAALDEGQLSAAMLDVTSPEPLPEGHPFYTHPAIFLTPHIAGVTRRETAVHALMDNVRVVMAGARPDGEIDRDRGY